MTPSRPASWTQTLARWLWPAAVFVLVLGWRADAVAASSASAFAPVSHFDVHEHSEHCKCRSKCRGASCCCGPRERKAAPTAPEAGTANPCLNADPCGEPGLPGSVSADPFGKAAALTVLGPHRSLAAGRFLPSAPRGEMPARRACRLDDPPERLAVA